MTTINSYTEDDNYVYIPVDKLPECFSVQNLKSYKNNICIMEIPQELLSLAIENLNYKIRSMPDFADVYKKHVDDCLLEGKDSSVGFTLKAVIHWNLWKDYCEYLIEYYKNTTTQNNLCHFNEDIKIVKNNTDKLLIC